MKRSKYLNVRTFRSDFTKLTEPVLVFSRSRLIGEWVPITDIEEPIERDYSGDRLSLTKTAARPSGLTMHGRSLP